MAVAGTPRLAGLGAAHRALLSMAGSKAPAPPRHPPAVPQESRRLGQGSRVRAREEILPSERGAAGPCRTLVPGVAQRAGSPATDRPARARRALGESGCWPGCIWTGRARPCDGDGCSAGRLLLPERAIVIAGTLLHFVYGLAGPEALVGLVSPVDESVREQMKLLVFRWSPSGRWRRSCWEDVCRVAGATLVEAIVERWPSPPSFTPAPALWGNGLVAWVAWPRSCRSSVGGQRLHRRVLLASQIPVPPLGSLLGLLARLVLYAVWTATPQACLCSSRPEPAAVGRSRRVPASLSSRRAAAGRAGAAAARAVGGQDVGEDEPCEQRLGGEAQGDVHDLAADVVAPAPICAYRSAMLAAKLKNSTNWTTVMA